MKPSNKLAEVITTDGARLTLVEHDGSYCIRLNGADLMHSRTSTSELILGQVGCENLPNTTRPRLLIGGLGLGFTLRGVLDQLGRDACVEVVELIPEVIDWNRRFLSALNGSLLDDPRVTVRAEDILDTLRRCDRGIYDAIILDVDNGPVAMVQRDNRDLYDRSGLKSLLGATKPGGRISIWSASRDNGFESRAKRLGLNLQMVPAKLYPGAKRSACTIYAIDIAASGKGNS